MENNIMIDTISQSAIQSGNLSTEAQVEQARLNAMVSDYSFRMSTLENKVSETENNVNIIKSNYLTSHVFYKMGGMSLIALIVSAGSALWATYSNLDGKIDNMRNDNGSSFASFDHRLDNVENRLTALEIKVDNIDSRLNKVESKIDSIDDKIDILIQQKTAQK